MNAGTIEIRLMADMARLHRDMEEARRTVNQSMGAMESSVANAKRAIAGLGIGLGIREIVQFANALYSTAAAAERVRMQLNFSFGGKAASELAFVRAHAHNLGLEFESTAQAYAKLSAASRGTALEGEGARSVFEAVSKAAVTMGLSAEQSSGVLLALEQMISKGVVSAEELRGQLGERLPGSFQIAARAMGVTTQELGEMLQAGQVLSEDFLPKFARQLQTEIGDSAEQAANRLDAATNRMSNAFDRLMKAVSESGIASFMASLKQGFANDMNAISEAMERARTRGAGTLGQLNDAAGMAIGRTFSLQRFSDDFKTFDAQFTSALEKVNELNRKPKLTLWERSDLAAAEKRLAALSAERQARDGATSDANAQDARLIAMGKAREAQNQANARAESELAEMRRKLAGVDKDYLPTLIKLQQQRAAGMLSEREYVALVADLASKNYKQSEAARSVAKGVKDGNSELAEQARLLSKLSDVNADYMQQLGRLQSMRVRMNMSDERYIALVTALIAEQPGAKKAMEEETELKKAMQKASEDLTGAGARQIASLEEEIRKQQEYNERIGLTEQQIAGLETKKLNLAAAADMELASNMRAAAQYAGPLHDAYVQYAADLEKAAGLKMQLAADRATGATDAANVKAAEDARKQLDEFLDPAKAKDFGSALRDAFGEAGNSLAQLTNALEDYDQKQAAIDKARGQARVAYANDADALAKVEEKLGKRAVKEQIGAYASMAGAAKGFFKESSKGYKALEAVEKGFRAYEMAMAMESMYTRLFANQTVTAAVVTGNAQQATSAATAAGTEVGAKMAVANANAVAGVANQANGDPYSAFPRMAAMAAIMAALGLAVGGANAGSVNVDLSKDRQAAQGTGTVLGAEDAKSQSIAKSIELLSENSNIALEHSSKMLATLINIRDGIAGLGQFVARGSGLRATAADQLKFNVGETRGGGLLGSGLFSSKTTTDIADSGVYFAPGQTLGSIMASGVLAQSYTDIAQTKKKWYGSSKTTRWTEFGELDESFLAQLGLTVTSMAAGIRTAAVALGQSGDAVEAQLRGLELGVERISLKGLSGEEAVAELEAVFSAMGDRMVTAAMPSVEQFQRVGEGLFETLVRVAHGVENAQFQLERFGITAIDYAAITNKAGDVGAEIVRQSILAVEGMSGIADIMNTLQGAAEDLADTYGDLLSVQTSLAMVGITGNVVSRDLVRGARDLGDLQSALDAYFDAYFTDAEKLAAKSDVMRARFQALGQTMPATMEGLRALIDGIPKTTAEGQLLLGQVLLLADGFADLHENMDPVRRAREQADAAMQFVDAAYVTLERAVDAERKARTAAHQSAMKAAADAYQDAVKVFDANIKTSTDAIVKMRRVSDALHSTLERMRVPGQELVERRAAQAEIAAAKTIASAGGMLDPDKLQKALAVVSQDSADMFSSWEEYQRDLYRTAIDIADLADLTDAELTVEQRTLEAIEQQKEQARVAYEMQKEMAQAAYDAEMTRLDGILDSARTQIDALNGINTSVLSVVTALQQFGNAVSSAQANPILGATPAITAAYQTHLNRNPETTGLQYWQDQAAGGMSTASIVSAIASSNEGQVQNLYRTVLGRSGEQAGVAFWVNALEQGVSLDRIRQDFLNSSEYAAKQAGTQAAFLHGAGVPGYASGGVHTGGWRIVGEFGPELEYTGPSSIINHSNSRRMLDMSALEDELRGLRSDMRQMQAIVARNTGRTADVIDRWERAGMPEQRQEENA